nr:Mu Gam-like end protection [uncultured phage]
MEILQVFATENKESLFSKTKSYKSAHGIFGFRTGTPKIKQLKGFTKESVLALVKAILPDYIRTAEEVAKDRLLADRDKEEVAEKLSKCGMVVVQDETFYVEPKKEDQPS